MALDFHRDTVKEGEQTTLPNLPYSVEEFTLVMHRGDIAILTSD